jgi:hypothetical protein
MKWKRLDINSKAFNELDLNITNIGQIIATRHLLSVASDILGIQNRGEKGMREEPGMFTEKVGPTSTKRLVDAGC